MDSKCEFEQTLADSEGLEAWHAGVHGITESDTTEQQQQTIVDVFKQWYHCKHV